ncbi:hypothetical protein QMO14_30895 [Variovorax sp. CAN2819]|nr:hypothetical protein [Variovorax sp. CAN15]
MPIVESPCERSHCGDCRASGYAHDRPLSAKSGPSLLQRSSINSDANNQIMKLSIALLQDFSYASDGLSLPFLYQLKFEKAVVLHGPIHITGCLLVSGDDDNICAGYTKNISSFLPGAEFVISPGTELVLAADVLEDQDGPNELISGTYELSAKVQIRAQVEGSSSRFYELRSSRQIVLS